MNSPQTPGRLPYENASIYYLTATKSSSILDFLSEHLPAATTPLLILNSGGVWKGNARLMDANVIIQPQETLKVYCAPNQGRHYLLKADQVVYETADFLVIDKPAGVTSGPDRSDLFYNMTAAVQNWLKDHGTPYLTHPITRLDFMVSGLMLFPKHQHAAADLSKLLLKGRLQKLYRARLTPKDHLPAFKRISDRLMFGRKCFRAADGKEARSTFIKRCETPDYVEYAVVLHTGRRHQIRFHASKYLSPIIGDGLYGSPIITPDFHIQLRASVYKFTYKDTPYTIYAPDAFL